MTQFDANPALVRGRALYLPTSARLHKQQPVGICTVIVSADGDICRKPFFTLESKVRHAAQCAKQHASAINAYRLRTHPEIMRTWDTELETWISSNRDAVISGRKRI